MRLFSTEMKLFLIEIELFLLESWLLPFNFDDFWWKLLCQKLAFFNSAIFTEDSCIHLLKCKAIFSVSNLENNPLCTSLYGHGHCYSIFSLCRARRRASWWSTFSPTSSPARTIRPLMTSLVSTSTRVLIRIVKMKAAFSFHQLIWTTSEGWPVLTTWAWEPAMMALMRKFSS